MKTTYHFQLISLLLVLFTVCACNKNLDIEPEGVMTEQSALGEKSTAENMLAGAYQQMFLAMNGTAYTIGDLTTGIATATTNGWYSGMVEPNDGVIANIWNNAYAAINLANVLINKLPIYAKFDQQTQHEYVAEARFIRAFGYLQLIKLFGEGALQNKPDQMGVLLRQQSFDGYDGSQITARATNKQVYDLIQSDLDTAIEVLPASYKDQVNTYCRATSTAAAALAARVSIYRHDYVSCIKYADMVLSDPDRVLAGSPVDVFKNNFGGNGTQYPFNKEIIFAFPVSYNKDPTQYVQHNITYINGYISPDSTFVASYYSNDLRKTEMIDTVTNYNGDIAVTVKFSDPDYKDNVVMLRLSEVILNKAEALAFKDGKSQMAVDLLNRIHQRAFAVGQQPVKYLLSDFTNTDALITQILQEKKWELAFEGLDRYDEITAGKNPNPTLSADKYALPIPQYDIEITNGVIKQNPGYIK